MSDICNHDPMFTLHIAGLRFDKSKSVIVKSWNIVCWERPEVPKLEQRDTIDTLLQSKLIHVYTFCPTTPNLSTATDDIRSPNTMSSVTFSRRCVKNSSSLSGSPKNSGQWHFSVAFCIEFKHQHIVIFEIINGVWKNIILKVHCFHGSDIEITIVSSIKIYNLLSPSE